MTNKESIMKFVDAGIAGLDAITGGGGKKCKAKSKSRHSKSHKSKSRHSHSHKSHGSHHSNHGSGCWGGSGWS